MKTFSIDRIHGLVDKFGYDLIVTYFIRDGDNGAIKIGKSSAKNIGKRLTSLQVGNQNELTIVGVIVGDCENEVQHKFWKYRICGEWFRPNANLISYIAEHREKL